MKEYAKHFYKSQSWVKTRNAYATSVGYLCEVCLKNGIYNPGEIVHHKTHITPENINNPKITLDWDNLELVCRECHGVAHSKNKRYRVDEQGKVIII